MKRLFALLFLLFALPAYGADVAQNAVADGSATVATSDYVSGYTPTGPTSQRYRILELLALKTSVTGNAGTATALAANGSNCSAGYAPLGVDASGAAESCWQVTPTAIGAIGGTLGATTNVLTKASGTGGATAQASGITEDGTNVNLAALNLVTTGTITGAIPVIADDTTLEAAQCYGSLNNTNGAETITLPAAAVGMSITIYSNDATVKHIDPNGTDTIVLTTAALTAGYQIESPGAAGDLISLVCLTANQWTAMGRSGIWISHGAD